MKKLALYNYYFILFILCTLSSFLCSNTANAGNYTWTGDTSTVWANSGNWSPHTGYPSTNDTATIVTHTNLPQLAANTTITRLVMTSGTLNLQGYDLTVSGTASCTGGTISNGWFKPTGSTITYSGTTFSCKVNAVVGRQNLNGSTFADSSYFEETNSTTTTGSGNNTFSSYAKFVKNSSSGSATWSINGTNGNTFSGNVVFVNNSSGNLVVAGISTTSFNGNIQVGSTSSGDVNIGSTSGGTSTLASGKTITIEAGGFSNGTLLIRDFTQSGSTSQSFTITSSAILNLISATFNGAVTFSAPSMLLKNSTFNGNATLTNSGSATSTSYGGNVFNGATSINNSGTAILRFTNSANDEYYANVTFTGNSTNSFSPSYANSAIYHGNLTYNGGQVSFTTGKNKFTGSATTQTYSGTAARDFNDLIIDKSAGYVTIDTTVNITDSLKLVSGNIVTTASHLIVMKAGSVSYGASNSSFISGPIKKIGNTAFAFPTGKGSDYRSVEINAPGNITDAFTGEYFDAEQTQGSNIDSTLQLISFCNYWSLLRNVGSSNVCVTLNWDSTNCGIYNRWRDVVVTHWQSSKWQNKGDTLKTTYSSLGSVRSLGLQSDFGYFTIGFRLVSADCNPPSPNPDATTCTFELICNGGFEQGLPGSNVSTYHLDPGGLMDCYPNFSEVINWASCIDNFNYNFASADLFIRGNTYLGGPYSIPNNNFSAWAWPYGGILDTWNSAPNDRYVGMVGTEGIITNLIAPIVPGHTYNLSFRAIALRSNPAAFTVDYNVYFIRNDANTNEPVSQTFTVPVDNQGWGLYNVAINLPAGMPPMENLVIRRSNVSTSYVFIDDVSLTTTDFATFTNDEPCVGTAAQFTSYVQGAGVTYAWDFGDGSTSTSANPNHTYAEPGYFKVKLTVTTSSCSNCTFEVIYVSPSCCAVDPNVVVYENQTTVPDHITTNTTWGTTVPNQIYPYRINRTITVDPGVTLDIAAGAIIEFGPGGKLIIERRGTVNGTPMDGAIVNMGVGSVLTSITNSYSTCPVMWQGVEVWGDNCNGCTHASSLQRQRHGHLNMDENAEIDNAHIGVLLGRTQLNLGTCSSPVLGLPNFDNSYDGGILNADNNANVFTGNAYAIRFRPFNAFNASRINDCIITGGTLLDDGYNSSNSYQYPNTRNKYYAPSNSFGRSSAAIHMWRVRGINFTDNTISDSQWGIQSFDAGFNVTSCSFTDHYYGIDHSRTITTPFDGHRITGTSFDLISLGNIGNTYPGGYIHNAGIRILAGRNEIITDDNIFGNMGAPDHTASGESYDFIGIQLLSTNGFTINDNQFGWVGIGIYSNASAQTQGLIGYTAIGNLFENVSFSGIWSRNNNPSLIVRCNLFDNQHTFYNSYDWLHLAPGTLPVEQGLPDACICATDTKLPAGNEFNLTDPNSSTNLVTGTPFVYHYHVPNSTFQSVIPTLIGATSGPSLQQKQSYSCDPPPPCNGCNPVVILSKLDSLQGEIDTLKLEYDSLYSTLDASSTSDLIDLIEDDEITSDSIRTRLLNSSLLSDEVLLAYFNREGDVDDDDFNDVMKENLPVSIDVIYSFNERIARIEDPDITADLNELQGYNPSRRTLTTVSREMEYLTITRERILDYAVNNLLDSNLVDSAIVVLGAGHNLYDSLSIVATYFELDSLVLARTILEGLSYNGDEFEALTSLYTMILDLADSGLTVFEMDSTQIAMVTDIANGMPRNLAVSNAQAIMKLVFGTEFEEEGYEERIAHNVSSNGHVNDKILPINEAILKIVPNPVKENAIVSYYLKPDSKKSTLKIFDVNGKTIKFAELKQGQRSVVIDCYNMNNGLYLLAIEQDNGIISSKRFIVHN